MSGDALAHNLQQNYSLASLQTVTGIIFAARLSSIRPQGVARAARHSASSHGGVLASPPRHHPRLPPTISGIASPAVPQAGHGLPPIQTYEEWLASQHQAGQHSLAKEDQRLGSSMTARKAAIYGATPEEWLARAAQRF
ncbi:hypothetical protein RTBOTA2_004461 [Rhodotorula toruloides]|nr:hypothetical protein RTBOTA2_004461 [Rhodotorula toruloides]